MVYDRKVQDRTLSFEISGGLIHAGLVFRDRETDSWWSLMQHRAIAGQLAGTQLTELPVSAKTTWRAWREAHPDTRVLSVGGREHAPPAYDQYFASERGFRGMGARDARLPDKAPVYAIEEGGRALAVAHAAAEGGCLVEWGQERLFLYREPGASLFASTVAYLLPRGITPERDEKSGRWRLGHAWLDVERGFGTGYETARARGMDTFWYTWSLSHPGTEVYPPAVAPGATSRPRSGP